MSAKNEVYVMSAVRTAIGGFGGSLKSFTKAELGAMVAKEAFARGDVDPKTVESCVLGSVVHTGPKDAYIARVVSVDAGMDISSNAVTVNRLCGSGLEAIIGGAQQIEVGEVDASLVGGTESMTNAAYCLQSNRWGQRMGQGVMLDELTYALQDPWSEDHMGITAENQAEMFSISRETQDAYAAESHRRAAAAIEDGRFKDQILPIEVKSRKATTIFDTDEHVRPGTTAEGIAGMRPAFKKDGSVTAANASGINDGAAMLVLMSGDRVKSEGRSPMARIVGYARAGVEPHVMGNGPIPAVKKVMERTGMTIDQMDVIESNEAFAVQACAVAQELGFDPAVVNPNGGAVALGHPVGATGAILTTKCLYELKRTGGKYGLVTMCIGGGQGIAAIFEMV